MEAALTKAFMDAEAFEFTMLAYFIDMALAEVRLQQRQQSGNPDRASRCRRWLRAIAFWLPGPSG